MYTGLIRRTDVGAMLSSGAIYKTHQVRDMLNEAEDIQVEDIRYGHWTEIIITALDHGAIRYQHKECTRVVEGTSGALVLHDYPFPICPFCGARMK